MTTEALATVLEISRNMLVYADNRDWDTIAVLQQKRMAILDTLPVNADDSEAWHSLADINQQLVSKLRALQSARIRNIAIEQRHSKVASAYSKT